MQEIWRDIKGYEGLYQVSNLGNVKRLKGKWVKKERLIKQGTTSTYDYYSVHLSNHQKTNLVFTHRIYGNVVMVGEIRLTVLFGNMKNQERRINMNYNKITLEECFVYYHTGKVACVCDGDEKQVKFMEE